MELRQVAYLLDIPRSAEGVQSYIEGYSREDFLKDPKTQDAVLRRLLVIDEAAADHSGDRGAGRRNSFS
jgi:uncharacterized protein with HEPN domain